MTESSSPVPAARPLDGVRILDFTRVLAGPLSTALLADLGAEVIKIEPPQGDDYRAIGPMRNGESALFTVMNRNKQSLVLETTQGMPSTSSLVKPLETLQTPTTSVSLSPLKR
jgi:CoA:oxalate CoA-transferase